MSNAGRIQLLSDWNLAFQNAGTKTLLGEGVSGLAGWSPQWGDFLLERAYLQGKDFFKTVTITTERVYLEVEKNGTTQLYDVNYTPSAGTTGAASLHIAEDSTQHVITPSDYICATGGHRGYVSGAVISKDVGFAIEGRYISGPLAGQGVHIGRRGNCKGFHVSGVMNGITYVFNFLGVTDAAPTGGTSWTFPTTGVFKGFTVPVPMRLRRMWMFGTVSSPSATPDDNDLVLRLYINDPYSTGTPDMECIQTMNTSIGQEFQKNDTSTTELAVGDEVYLILQQVRNAGTGTANLIDLNLYLEWEAI